MPDRFALVLLIGALTFAPSLHAQRVSELPAGARVRVHTQSRPPLTGTVTAVTADSLGLAAGRGAPEWLQRGDIRRVDRSVGPESGRVGARRGARRGAIVGVAVSAAAIAAGVLHDRRHCGVVTCRA